jgi:hypothetical protein
MAGQTYRPKTKANSLKLTKLEEEVVCRNILKLDSQGFTPQLAGVKDIANFILELQEGTHVSIR